MRQIARANRTTTNGRRERGIVARHNLRRLVDCLRRLGRAVGNGGRRRKCPDAGNRRGYPGRRQRLPPAAIHHHRDCRCHHLYYRRLATRASGRHRLPDRRRPLGLRRLYRHAGLGPRQRPHRPGRQQGSRPRPRARLPGRRRHRHARRWPRPSRRRRLLRHPRRHHGPRHHRPRRGRLAGRPRLRRLAHLDLRPPRRRHLHQGCGRRRRPRWQGRGRYPRGRPAQPRHHRRQRRRQRRRLRRHGRRPLRDLRRDLGRHHGPRLDLLRRPGARLYRHALPAGDLRPLRAHLHRRHFRGEALAERHHHGRALQGLHRHRRPVADPTLPADDADLPGPDVGADDHQRRRQLHRQRPVLLRRRRPHRHHPHRRHHRVLHRHRLPPGALHRPGLDHRPRHQRHSGPRRLAGVDRPPGPRDHRRHHLHLHARGPLRHRHCGHDDAGARRRGGSPRRLRPRHRQRRRHRRDGGSPARSARHHRRPRRGRQHHQGGDQGLRHRLRRPRRAGALHRLHRGPEVLRHDRRPGQLLRRAIGRLLALQPVRRRRPALRRPPALTSSAASP